MASGRLKTTRSKIMAFLVYVALAAAVGGVMGYIDNNRAAAGELGLVHSNAGVWVGLTLGTLAAIIGMVYGFFWMRSIDEAAQEAHKWSWYWGGSAGMALGMIGLVMAMLPVAEQWQPPAFLVIRTDPAGYMALGAVAIVGLMLLGYIIAWLWWWWGRR